MTTLLLEVTGLQRKFGGVVAVAGVDFAIQTEELRCIIGPNGAGKSTFFNMLCGTLSPTDGRIEFEGHDIVGLPPHRFARLGIARKFQVPSIFETLTVFDNIEVARLPEHSLKRTPPESADILHMLSLEEVAEVSAGELSHGQKQWLEIGMALMSAPKLLLLDEPTAGMSVEETHKTARLLVELKGHTAIVVIEHDMQFVRDLNARTTVLHQGRIIAEGSFESIEANDTIRDIYLGRA